MKNKIITIVTSLVMVVTLIVPTATYAASDDSDKYCVMGNSIKEEYSEEGMSLMASKSIGSFSPSTYKAQKRGIDVSRWQGSINWAKAKSAGVQYAIIRAGCTKSDGTIYKDPMMDTYVKNCEANGIPYGFYYYSCATTTAKVDKEIASLKNYILGTYPTYPVYYDLEDSKISGMSSSFINNMATKFCEEISKEGYRAGIYASLSWWNSSKLNSTKLDKYEKWIAQWPKSMTTKSRCSYTKAYGMWQFTSSGTVSGISGYVDLDLSYDATYGDTPGEWIKDEEGYDVFNELLLNADKNPGDPLVYQIAKSKWITSGNKPYYLDENGHKMSGGIHEINGSLYYFTGSGYIYKGRWITSGNNKYYALASGKLCRNGTAKLSNYWYGFNSEGQMLKGWKSIGTKGYYFFSNGKSCLKTCVVKKKVRTRKGASTKYKRGITLKKNKTVYVIRTYGKWCQLSNGYWVQSKYLKVKKSFPYAVAIKPVVVPDETTEATAAEEETKTLPDDNETTQSTTTTNSTESSGEGGNTGSDSSDQPAPDEPLN